jgi:hypothetical protein
MTGDTAAPTASQSSYHPTFDSLLAGEQYAFQTRSGHLFNATFHGIHDDGTLDVELGNGRRAHVNPTALFSVAETHAAE